jgi:hypothetical protein
MLYVLHVLPENRDPGTNRHRDLGIILVSPGSRGHGFLDSGSKLGRTLRQELAKLIVLPVCQALDPVDEVFNVALVGFFMSAMASSTI